MLCDWFVWFERLDWHGFHFCAWMQVICTCSSLILINITVCSVCGVNNSFLDPTNPKYLNQPHWSSKMHIIGKLSNWPWFLCFVFVDHVSAHLFIEQVKCFYKTLWAAAEPVTQFISKTSLSFLFPFANNIDKNYL